MLTATMADSSGERTVELFFQDEIPAWRITVPQPERATFGAKLDRGAVRTIDQLLANIGASTVILAGVSVDAGIEATMRSAGDRGYGSVIAIDACAAGASVEAQLAGAERGIANVRTVAEIAHSLV